SRALDGATQLPLPAGVMLAADEKLLWTGRPRERDPINQAWFLSRLKMLAWLMIPTALLLWALGIPSWVARAHWGVGVVAGVWLLAGVYGMTIDPLVQTRRRRRTVYLLTNVRAIR